MALARHLQLCKLQINLQETSSLVDVWLVQAGFTSSSSSPPITCCITTQYAAPNAKDKVRLQRIIRFA